MIYEFNILQKKIRKLLMNKKKDKSNCNNLLHILFVTTPIKF